MIYKTFAVKDKALDSFSAPFTQATIDAGIRMWRDLVLFDQGQNRYKNNPEDYSLYLIGEYDDTTGQSTNIEKPQYLSSAAEVLADQPGVDHGA